ncbi:hypothetical protein ACWD7C_42240 [Streptomyces sp. NPDC005134]|uniref:hypothetical protein n=1 Tax=unclassified Streptomyces TaxID=2593676 RepID=UPI0033A38592
MTKRIGLYPRVRVEGGGNGVVSQAGAVRRDVPPMGPGTAPEKYLLCVGVAGLLIAAPGAAVGYFEGFQDGTEVGDFAWGRRRASRTSTACSPA